MHSCHFMWAWGSHAMTVWDNDTYITCKVNNFVCVYPRLPGDGVEELDYAGAEDTLFWLAKVAGIRAGKNDEGEDVALVRLQWFYTRHCIRSWLPGNWLNKDAKRYVSQFHCFPSNSCILMSCGTVCLRTWGGMRSRTLTTMTSSLPMSLKVSVA